MSTRMIGSRRMGSALEQPSRNAVCVAILYPTAEASPSLKDPPMIRTRTSRTGYPATTPLSTASPTDSSITEWYSGGTASGESSFRISIPVPLGRGSRTSFT
ncbi:MAG: hypothetical protein A4E67_00651 [Syntrophaceae bacterium PtaB.Bin038]|nr:MAG: hypothetical protein A4E67_00651 [Syntrophaceae bacterium PtaB.Bin038]